VQQGELNEAYIYRSKYFREDKGPAGTKVRSVSAGGFWLCDLVQAVYGPLRLQRL